MTSRTDKLPRMKWIEWLQTLPQHLIPQHWLSRALGSLANCQLPAIKNFLIKLFIRYYQVNMEEAIHANAEDYTHFNDFFTRHLKDKARPITATDDQIACPVDGCVSQLGKISGGKILQAKGHDYSLQSLLGDSTDHAQAFHGGHFATLYLAPKDYHRIHMPITGTLREMVHIPGHLFSVNPRTTRTIDNLFSRNERVVCLFDTEVGPMAMVLVGAVIVASIATIWADTITPPTVNMIRKWNYQDTSPPIQLMKGDEMGHFKLGSTVILLFGPDAMSWLNDIQEKTSIRMGQILGNISKTTLA